MKRAAILIAVLAGCQVTKEPSPEPALQAAPKPQVAAVASGQAFGKSVDPATPFVALSDIVKDPKAYQGKRVRTRGEVVAVCQAAGCWADLKPEGAANVALPTHVTMHDHAFLLPKNAKTKVAEIEGNLVVRELTQDECDHYNSEGASLTAGTPVVNVDALGVVLR